MSANPIARPDDMVHRGLAGIVFDETRITDIQGKKGELRYRGYSIDELAIQPSFEKTAYLLLHGEWPTTEQHHAFCADLAARRVLPESTVKLLSLLRDTHPDDALRTALSSLNLGQHDGSDQSEIGLDLIAKIPSLITTHHAIRSGRGMIEPDPTLDHATDFLRRLLGRLPTVIEQEVINLDFVLHADHGANASTFAGRVVASTGADIVGAIVGAMAALTGPLHGGAVSAAGTMLSSIEAATDVAEFVAERRQNGLPIFGFGHRVYRTRDPRSDHYCRAASVLSKEGDKTIAILDALIEAMAPYKRMGIAINDDLYAAVVYRLLGLPADLATGTFAASRSVGWVAQVLEQQADNILIRPRLRYTGPNPRQLCEGVRS